MNPDVKFITPFVTIWDPAKFGMFNHAAREYVHFTAGRMGRALADFVKDEAVARPFQVGDFSKERRAPPAVQPVRAATDAEKYAALAYYLLTATADDVYRGGISDRVLAIMDADKDFNTMMSATAARLAQLKASSLTTLGYNASGIKAEVVGVAGLPYCGGSRQHLWVRLSGAMSFSYQSPQQNIAEAVEWPQASQLVIPIATDGSIPKFDGYCEEAR